MLCHLTHLPDFDKKEIADLAYELITSPDCSISGRTSGLQVCAELNNKEALPLARDWAANSKKTFIKMSAIAAIGMLGDKSDLTLLEQYSTSTDIRLRTPALAAIRKIKSRR
jgi:HEAT repeat protein